LLTSCRLYCSTLACIASKAERLIPTMATTESATNEKVARDSSPSSDATAHEESRPHAHPRFADAPSEIPATKPEQSDDDEKDGDEKIELTEEDCYDELGFSFPQWKKWTILTVIFWVQVSMNFNTSLYSNALVNNNDGGITKEFGVSEQAARVGAAIFLITYAFGCELWAPWSEEFGRWPILQLSLGLVNIWNLPVALAPNFGSLVVGRALGGLSSAGGSVTLGMIADIYEADNQQYAIAYIVFSSVGGSVLGPVVGGFVQQYLGWRWCIWIQLIFGGFIQLVHFLFVPETRTTVMMDKIAKKRRKNGEKNIYGPGELTPLKERLQPKEILITWIRPFKMFVTEPIVLTLSLLSGFSDALIFMQIQSFSLVYKQWNFNDFEIGLSFCAFLIGYFICWGLFVFAIERNKKERAAKPHDEHAQYESRLWFLLYTAPCLPIGLIIFAWTCGGPPIHWIGSLIGAAIVGIGNYAIYMATIDYMICAYGPYSASATGGNGWSRDFLAGVLTIPATPFYSNIGPANRHLQYGNTIMFCISAVLVIAVYVIYFKGPVLRKRSPFAQQLAGKRDEHEGRRASYVGTGTATPSRPGASRRSSYAASQYAATRSRDASRNPSRNPSRRNSFSKKQRPANSRQHSHAAKLTDALHEVDTRAEGGQA